MLHLKFIRLYLFMFSFLPELRIPEKRRFRRKVELIVIDLIREKIGKQVSLLEKIQFWTENKSLKKYYVTLWNTRGGLCNIL